MECANVQANDAQITCATPAGSGLRNQVIVVVNGNSSQTNEFFFDYDGILISAVHLNNYYLAPNVTSVTPGTGPTIGGTSITIAGTNFGPSSTEYAKAKASSFLN